MRRALRAQRERLLAALGDNPEREPDEAFWQAENEALTAALQPTLGQAAQLAAQAHGAQVKSLPVVVEAIDGQVLPDSVPILWDDVVIAAAAVDWARRYVGELIRNVTRNTQDLVRRAVSSFINTPGMTIGDLTRMLEPAFGRSRAHRIAVTETTRAFTEGQRLVQQELRRGGLGLERVWRTSMDEVVCPICGALEDKRESEGWGYDGPPAHPNCRCWTVLAL